MSFEACYLEVIDQKRSLKTARLATWCRFRCNLWIHEMIFDQTEQLVHFWAATIIINHIYCLFFFIEIYRIAFRWNTNFFFTYCIRHQWSWLDFIKCVLLTPSVSEIELLHLAKTFIDIAKKVNFCQATTLINSWK